MGKTEDALSIWCSASNIEFKNKEAEEAYKNRAKRIADAIQLKVPDRVPITPIVNFFPAKYVGITVEECMYDYKKAYAAYKKTTLDFQFDAILTPNAALPGRVLEALDYKQLRWAGHGVAPDSTYQFVEGEYMKANEYDVFLEDPSDFIIRTYLPRACGVLQPFQKLPPLIMAAQYYIGLFFMLRSLLLSSSGNAIESINKAIAEFATWAAVIVPYSKEMKELGFPSLRGGATQAPFDTLGDALRGTKGIMLDMYRQPDNVLRAVDKLLPSAIQMGVMGARAAGDPFVFIPLHKGAMGFMSLDQFKKFYWPTFQKLLLGLIDEGIIPVVAVEANYDDRLETIKDIPPGKAIYWFELTDMAKAKEVLGNRVCIRGNVPASLLCSAKPQEVTNYCRKLIEVAGKGGGFIMDGSIGIPDEAKIENVYAMRNATEK